MVELEALWENQSLGLYGNSSSGTVNTTRTEAKDDVSLPPPPQVAAQAASSKKRDRGGGSGVKKCKKAKKGGISSEEVGDQEKHDIHILTERERRKKMRDLFVNLHTLVPTLTNKADKSAIVDAAVVYIKSLESTLDSLEKKKQERQQLNKTREAFLADQVVSSTSNNINSLVNPSSSNFFNSSSSPQNRRFSVGFQVWTSANVVLTICGDEAQFTICSPKKFGTLSFILLVLDKYNIEVSTANVSSHGNRNIIMIQTHARGVGQDELEFLFSVEEIYKKASDEIMQWTLSDAASSNNHH